MNQQNQKIKKELKTAIILSLIPIYNYLTWTVFSKFCLVKNVQVKSITNIMFDDKKKRWVGLGSHFFLLLLCYALFLVSKSTGYNIIPIVVYLIPMISNLPLFLYDWNKYVIKGEPWPNE